MSGPGEGCAIVCRQIPIIKRAWKHVVNSYKARKEHTASEVSEGSLEILENMDSSKHEKLEVPSAESRNSRISHLKPHLLFFV